MPARILLGILSPGNVATANCNGLELANFEETAVQSAPQCNDSLSQ